jgi:NADPH2:quinone reductase
MLRSVSSKLFFQKKPTTHLSHNIIRTMSTAAATTTMKAVVINEQGGVDKLIYKDVPLPKVTPDSIIVKNRFVGVNFIDTYHRSGLYSVQLPFTLGKEG